jgi:hypothetical protein
MGEGGIVLDFYITHYDFLLEHNFRVNQIPVYTVKLARCELSLQLVLLPALRLSITCTP